ncbi:MAG TPA: HD domain-containing protein, partial [Actinoplanes sp.]|nr:HD domain-containing protein [Actinoplanes sp.]
MDVDAGHGAALGRALPTPGSPRDMSLSQRLRMLLNLPGNDDNPVAKLTRTHKGIHPSADTNILRRSYAVADNMHRGQLRKSGDPYITHPLAVAQICAELGMDTTTLVA